MVGLERPSLQQRQPFSIRVNRPNQMAGNAQCSWRSVTLQTLITPHKTGLVGLPLVQRIKHSAAIRIHRGNFHDLPALHPADVDVIIEVQCPGIRRRDVLKLKTRFGKHQRLR